MVKPNHTCEKINTKNLSETAKNLQDATEKIINAYDLYFHDPTIQNGKAIIKSCKQFHAVFAIASHNRTCDTARSKARNILKKIHNYESKYLKSPTWATRAELEMAYVELKNIQIKKPHTLKHITIERKISEDQRRHKLQHEIRKLEKSYVRQPTMDEKILLTHMLHKLENLPNVIGAKVVCRNSELIQHIRNPEYVRRYHRRYKVTRRLQTRIRNLESDIAIRSTPEMILKLQTMRTCFEHNHAKPKSETISPRYESNRKARANKILRYLIRELQTEYVDNPNFATKGDLQSAYNCLEDAIGGKDVISRIKEMRLPKKYAREFYLTKMKSHTCNLIKEYEDVYSKSPSKKTLSGINSAKVRLKSIENELHGLRKDVVVKMTNEQRKKLRDICTQCAHEKKKIARLEDMINKSPTPKVVLKLKKAVQRLEIFEQKRVDFRMKYGMFAAIRRKK